MTMIEAPALTLELPEGIHRALRHSGLNLGELAAAVGASRNTVSRWVNGVTTPNMRDRRAIELATGLPQGWLEAWCARRDSNPQPSVLYPTMGLDAALLLAIVAARMTAATR